MIEGEWNIGSTVTDEEFLQWYHVDGPECAKAFGVPFNPIGLTAADKELLERHK
jgi:hypothetical protein